ncbi:MAG: RNA polymerase sigma factor [Anaerolineales bacterium]
MNEYELIQAAKNNDLEAFNELVLKYRTRIFNHAYYFLQNHDAAEDATQEVFLKSFRKLYQFHGDSFLAWLLRITTNHCHDEFRASKLSTLIPLEIITDDGEIIETPFWMEDPAMQPEDEVESNELRAELEDGLIELPSYYQNAVSLIDIQQLSYKEAAAMMQISIGTLKSRLKRGRQQMRNNFTNRYATNVLEQFNLDPSV